MIDLPAGYVRLVIPETLLSLTRSCETVCVAGCCGVDAFDVSADRMAAWIRENGPDVAHQALGQIQDIIGRAGGRAERIWSDQSDFNMSWAPEACAAYFRRWQIELIRALELAADKTMTS